MLQVSFGIRLHAHAETVDHSTHFSVGIQASVLAARRKRLTRVVVVFILTSHKSCPNFFREDFFGGRVSLLNTEYSVWILNFYI